MTGLIIVVVIVVVLLIAGCLGIKQSRRALEKTAADMGLTFQPAVFSEADMAKLKDLEKFPLFSFDYRYRSMRKLMTGEVHTIRTRLFEYSVGAGRSNLPWYTVVWFQSNKLDLPDFVLFPVLSIESNETSALKGCCSRCEYKEIDFSSNPEFSKRHFLAGKDEEAVRKLFSPEVISFFQKHPEFRVQGGSHQFIFHEMGTLSVGFVRPALEKAYSVFKLLETK